MLMVSPALSARLLALEMTDVFVVHVDIDEAAEPAFVGVQMPAKIAVAPDEPLQALANRRAFDFDDVLLAGERAKRCRDQNSMGHVMSSRSKPERSSRRVRGPWLQPPCKRTCQIMRSAAPPRVPAPTAYTPRSPASERPISIRAAHTRGDRLRRRLVSVAGDAHDDRFVRPGSTPDRTSWIAPASVAPPAGSVKMPSVSASSSIACRISSSVDATPDRRST